MPRPVVPSFLSPRGSSRARSSAPCEGRISGVVGEAQRVGRDRQPLVAHQLDFGDQRPGIDDDAIADDRQLAGSHDARRQQAHLEFDIADDEGVAGVGSALKADHDVGPLRQPVDDLASECPPQ
jgi:hypothetical protein